MLSRILLAFIFSFGCTYLSAADSQVIRVASKRFTESYILAEIMAQLLEDRGFEVDRKMGLGGTMIAFGALESGDIDVYPEYTGTLKQAVFKADKNLSREQLKALVDERGLDLLEPFGFNNTYAIALRGDHPLAKNLRTISDLKDIEGIEAVLGHEFVKRPDGWHPLRKAYSLKVKLRTLDHNLAYDALASGESDLMDVYTTDAKVGKMNLRILEDDKKFFPTYLALPLVHKSLPPKARQVLLQLAGTIDETEMIRLNGLAEIDKLSFSEVARRFLTGKKLIQGTGSSRSRWDLGVLAKRTGEHLWLTFVAMILAALVAVPLGVILFRLSGFWARPILIGAGLLQTIPSIALLAFMIPIFGIGVKPAVMGLFLYSLLPILRNTYAALSSINPQLLLVARGIGLYSFETLRLVELPLALPVILTGLRTAAVINVGTATLAAFIGAGGLGQPIVAGLALNDTGMILQGAVPAALLAVVVELMFDYFEKLTAQRYGQTVVGPGVK